MRTTAQACRDLGISWHTLSLWMKKLGIEATRHEYDLRLWMLSDEDIERIRQVRASLPRATPSRSPAQYYRTEKPTIAEANLSHSAIPASARASRREAQHEAHAAGQGPRMDRLPDGWEPLPDGWVPVSRFCTLHNLNTRSVERQSHEGRISMPMYEERPEAAPWGSWSAGKGKWYPVTTAYRDDQLVECERVAKEIWPERWRDEAS